jgi:hypothetical protein
MATVGEIETHQTVMRTHEGLVDLQVGRASTQALNVDAPLGGVEVEGLQGTGLACELDGIDVLVATIVTGTGVTLRVLVGHRRAKSIEDGVGSEVLRGDQDNGFTLTLNLFFLLEVRPAASIAIEVYQTYHDLGDLGIGLNKSVLHLLDYLVSQ